MTLNQKIEAVREKCVEYIPSIMELNLDRKDFSFGLDILKPKFYWMSLPDKASEMIDRGRVENKVSWFLDRELHEIQNRAYKGREVRLADVLYVLDKKAQMDSSQKWNDHMRYLITPKYINGIYQENPQWNLLSDSLTFQSPETIDFLYSLLVK